MPSNTLRSLSLIAASLIISISSVIGQDLSSLPACSLTCAESAMNAINKACAMTDFNCLCHNDEYIRQTSACFTAHCPPDDISKAVDFGRKTCASVGVNLPLPPTTPTAGPPNAAGNATSPISNGAGNGSRNGPASHNTTTTPPATGSSPVNGSAPSPPDNSNMSSAPSLEAVRFFAVGAAVASLVVLS